MFRAQELSESRRDRPGLSVTNSSYGLCGRKAPVSIYTKTINYTVQELCKSQGGRAGLPVPNSPCGLCRCKATPKKKSHVV